MVRSGPDLEDFLRTRAPEVRRVSLLVDGDPSRARRTAEAVLVEVAGQWRELSDEGRPSSRTWAALAERLLALPEPAPGDPSPSTDPVALAWARLPRATRLAWVAEHDDPPGLADGLASVRRMPPAPDPDPLTSARTALADALARRRTDEGRPPASQWEAGREVATLLDELGAPTLTWGDPVESVAAHRRRRRQRTAMVVGGVVALALVGGGVVAASATREPAVAGGAGSSPSATFSLPTTSNDRSAWAGWPTRGSLATDGSLTSGVIRRYGSGVRILWTHEVDGRRQVLLAPRTIASDDHPELTLLTGPAGTAVSDLVESKRWASSRDPLITLIDRTGGGQAQLVVLAPPDLPAAEVSRAVTVGADFSIERTWERVPLERGGAVVSVGAGRGGALLVRAGPATTPPGLTDPDAWSYERVDCTGCAWPEARDRMVTGLRTEIGHDTGLAPEQIAVDIVLDAPLRTEQLQIWDKSLSESRALMVRWTLSSGAVLQSVLLAGQRTSPEAIGWSSWMDATPVPPDRLMAPTVMPVGGGPTGSTLIVLTPRGSPAAAVSAGRPGEEQQRVPITAGVATIADVPDSDNTTVTTYDATGTHLLTGGLWESGVWDGPWDLYDQVNN